MAEKEINLDGTQAPKPQPQPETPKADSLKTLKDKFASEMKPGASTEDLVNLILSKSQDDLLPWEPCELPSMGIFYGGAIPSGKVQVRPMGLFAEKILATQRLTQSGKAIDEIFKRCVKFPSAEFDPLDLLAGDRVFLLFYLRGITHGNIYEFMLACTNEACAVTSTYEYDLNKIGNTIRRPKHQTEPVPIDLPYLSEVTGRRVWVEIRFMRGRDLQIIGQKSRFTSKLTGNQVRSAKTGEDLSAEVIPIDQSIEENLNLVTVSIGGAVRDRHKIAQFMSKLHAKDSATIRQFLNREAPGIDTQIIVNCPVCNNKMTLDLPITESFFRPKDSGGVRE